MMCTICEKPFKDTWSHVQQEWEDPKHRDRFQSLENSLEPQPEMCFCGGDVLSYNSGEAGWSRECSECGFVYNED